MRPADPKTPPTIVDQEAWGQFRMLATRMGLDPDDLWVGGYVTYEWSHARHFFEAYARDLDGKRVLEFGCNVGASGIVLASLGAKVVGVEVDAQFAELARAQAAAYGFDGRVEILHVEDTARLPFPDRHLNLIVCNSVLEYVAAATLGAVEKELLRVLAPGGVVLVMGTSNRLWPKEVHSGRWLSNYIPRGMDGLFGGKGRQRGISPFSVRNAFAECTLIDKEDGGACYVAARERMGTSSPVLSAMRIAATVLSPFPVTVGMLMPSFAMALRRPAV